MDYSDRIPRAAEALFNGYESQEEQNYEHAIKEYERSIALYPTAEAYTYCAWATSIYKEDYDEAIRLCERAIEVNKEYGNSYNDIGAYLIQKGELKESIHWFKMSISIKSYDLKHYSYFNLGKVYENMGYKDMAIENYKKSLEIEPDYTLAQSALNEIMDSN